MRKLLSHPYAKNRPTAFFAPAPATARFNNSTEKYRPGISHPRTVTCPAVFFAPTPAMARFNNSTEKYRPEIGRASCRERV